MSRKWDRAKQWDDQHLTGALRPLKWVLRAFSSITMAVTLMALLSLYGIMASIPVGMLAMIPTYAVYGLSTLLAIALGTALPLWLVNRAMARAKASIASRWVVSVAGVLVLSVLSVYLWALFVLPVLNYNPITGTGVRFFADFIEQYKGVPMRRLPGMEMSELEFYAWWPLNAILYLFVVNMIVATVRRIEFSFENIGVLTVHTGIIVIALGSAYYSIAKQEGDTLLIAGQPGPDGTPAVGQPVDRFYDNTKTVLRITQSGPNRAAGFWEQRLLTGLPRYNEYNIQALREDVGIVAQPEGAPGDKGRTLSINLPAPPYPPGPDGKVARLVDPDIQFRVVGYAPYAELQEAWRPVRTPGDRLIATDNADALQPVRFIEVVERLNPATGRIVDANHTGPVTENVRQSLEMLMASPAGRIAELFRDERGQANLVVEYSSNMDQRRWNELAAPLPEGSEGPAQHALMVDIPADPASGEPGLLRSYAIAAGKVIEVGNPAWKIEVRSISPTPPFNIITPGYENATSSVAVVRVTPPPGKAGGKPFERYLYHRFPEIAQDLLEETTAAGRPARRAADPAIRLSYIDASIIQVYFDERPAVGADASQPPEVRALVRIPRRAAQVTTGLKAGDVIMVGPPLKVRLGERWADAERLAVPVVVPEIDRDRDNTGNHKRAALCLEISLPAAQGRPAWSRRLWLPFRQYQDIEPNDSTSVRLPDGRELKLVFGRLWRPLPDMVLRLKDFEMIPYPHSTQPRDFRSDLQVVHGPGVSALMRDATFRGFDQSLALAKHAGAVATVDRHTSLNDPLKQSPFMWEGDRPWPVNAVNWFLSQLGPTQYKFSQAGWDSTHWNDTRAQAEAGQLPRAYARFTILGVGNNPGIYVIAFGSILMSVGIPWAFYIKPWLVRRKRDRIKADLAAVGKAVPRRTPAPAGVPASAIATSTTREPSPLAGAQRP